MPLFHHKEKHTTNAPLAGTGTGADTHAGVTAPGTQRPYDSTNLNTTNVIPGSGTHHQHADGPGLAGQGPHHLTPQTGYNNETYPQQATYANDGYGTSGHGGHPGVGATGVGAGTGMGQHGHMHGTTVGGAGMGAGAGEVPSAHVINRSPQGHASGGGSSLTGKLEHAVGAMVGSSSLKMKGELKQEEARAAKMQAAEIQEAERLEGEARMRRERAVAHGAHPNNMHPSSNSGAGTGF